MTKRTREPQINAKRRKLWVGVKPGTKVIYTHEDGRLERFVVVKRGDGGVTVRWPEEGSMVQFFAYSSSRLDRLA